MHFSFNFRKLAISAAVISAGLALGAPAQADALRLADNHTGGEMTDTMSGQSEDAMNIVETASNSSTFNTLVQAVQSAELAETLSGEGPYTVFAPTNEAFSQLPEGALEFLLQPENQDILAEVLTYHVVQGEITSDEITSGPVDAMGGGLAVNVSESGVVVNNASVINPDIEASNGVIHGINRVLIPEALQQQLASELGVSDIYQ